MNNFSPTYGTVPQFGMGPGNPKLWTETESKKKYIKNAVMLLIYLQRIREV